MIVPRTQTSFATGRGAHPRHAPRSPSHPTDPVTAVEARGRWSDDGGAPAPPPLRIVGPIARQPGWSVLSPALLERGIGEARTGDPAVRPREDERARIRAVIAESDRVTAAAHDNYRRMWRDA